MYMYIEMCCKYLKIFFIYLNIDFICWVINVNCIWLSGWLIGWFVLCLVYIIISVCSEWINEVLEKIMNGEVYMGNLVLFLYVLYKFKFDLV